MGDFDESLPGHSVFVPAEAGGAGEKKESKVTPKPFLRKGSRREPSALHKTTKKHSGGTNNDSNASSGSTRDYSQSLSTSQRGRPSVNSHDSVTTAVASGDYSNNKSTEAYSNDDTTEVENNKQHLGGMSRPQNIVKSDDIDPLDPLDTSIMSTSTLCFGDTSTIDLQQRWAQEQQRTKVELDEFAKMEQELDSIQVTPLLMTSTEKARGESFPKSQFLNGDGISNTHHQYSKVNDTHTNYTRNEKFGFNEDYGEFTSGGGLTQGQIRPSVTSQQEYEYDEDFEDYDADHPTENDSWVNQPASYFMSSGREQSSSSVDNQVLEGNSTEYNALRHSQGTRDDVGNGDNLKESISLMQIDTDSRDLISSSDFNRTPKGAIAHSTFVNAKHRAAARNHTHGAGQDYHTDENHHCLDEGNDQPERFEGKKSRTSMDHVTSTYTYDAHVDKTFDEDMYDNTTCRTSSPKGTSSPEIGRSRDSVDDTYSWEMSGVAKSSAERTRTVEGETGQYYSRQTVGNGAIGGLDVEALPDSGSKQQNLKKSLDATPSLSASLNNFATNRNNTATMRSRTGSFGRKSTGALTSGKAIRPGSAGKTRSASASRVSVNNPTRKQNVTEAPLDDVGIRLSQKAKELEQELETYKNENEKIKHARKQQESLLADMEKQRADLKTWIESERKKTSDFCSESKEAAIRERRAAAKYVSYASLVLKLIFTLHVLSQARDTKAAAEAGNHGPNRKERAEIEALKATIQKLKIDHEESLKKWKTNNVRCITLLIFLFRSE